ncbi:MAG: hypothetical protein ACK44D_12605, partial [Bacteroidia bacterium]
DRFFYDERTSKIANLYQLRNDTNSSHFSGLRILTMLDNKSMEKISSGFMDAKYLIQKFENDYDLKTDCEKHLDVFLQKGIVESNNRLEEFSEKIDQIRITALGKYLLDFLAYDFTYLDLISLDCGFYSESLNAQFIKAAYKELDLYHTRKFYDRVLSRLNRVEAFINYLGIEERKEFESFGLAESELKFYPKLKSSFNEQKERILRSASSRKSDEIDDIEE